MLLKTLFVAICFLHFELSWETDQGQSDVGLNPKQLVRKYGYPLEVHTIHTEDGYMLETHRIPHGINKTSSGRPVLIMPGAMCSSAIWISLGPKNSLGFILADEGYDVWLANYRGSTWSRKHERLNPDQDSKKFFDFSYQEIGYYDVPANIDYILNITNQDQLFFIGHSQGTTTFFAMGADRPEYNKKIKLMIALAPVAYTSHLNNSFFDILGKYFDLIKIVFETLRLYEFLPYNPLIGELAKTICDKDSLLEPVCRLILNTIAGPSSTVDTPLLPLIASNLPAGTSSRSFLHTIQQTRTKKFEHYDFGFARNLLLYGQKSPPQYNVTKITASVALYYSDIDAAAPIEDVEQLISELPNLVYAKPINNYGHIDYLWASNVYSVLYKDVIKLIKRYS